MVSSCGRPGKNKTGSGALCEDCDPNDPTNPEDTGPAINCPEGFLGVHANSIMFNTNRPFCVMAYEAREGEDGLPHSTPQGPAWAGLSAVEAKDKCRALGQRYDLISNNEWMTIAHHLQNSPQNFELHNSNFIYPRGWSANEIFSDNWTNLEAAPHSHSSCLYNVSTPCFNPLDQDCYDNCSSTGHFTHRRTHYLHGKELWDFAGNLGEWVDWTQEQDSDDFSKGPTLCGPGFWMNLYNVSCSALTPQDVIPSTGVASFQEGLGMFFGGAGGAAFRGGAFDYGHRAGIYTLELHFDSTNPGIEHMGFRCVFRP